MQQNVIQGFRLSPQQDRLWALQGHEEGAPYRATCVLRIAGRLDVQALQAALGWSVERHEILRTTFRQPPGMEPLQVIGEGGPVRIERCELNGGSPGEWEAIEALLLEMGLETDSPFDLETGEGGVLLRARLAVLAPDRHLLLLDLPSLCADATSLANLAGDVARCYAAQLGGPAPGEAAQYADAADWMSEVVESQEAVARRFWEACDITAGLDARLPFEAGEDGRSPFAPRSLPVEVAPETVAGLARELGAGEDAVLLAAWRTLLRRLTGRADAVVGVACRGRKHEELDEALGLFVRHLPMPCAVAEEASFTGAVRAAAEALDELSAWQDSFAWSHLKAGGAAFCPFAFEYVEMPAGHRHGDTTFTVVCWRALTERFRVKLVACRRGEALDVELQYDEAALPREAAGRLAGWLRTLLESAAVSPRAAALDLGILTLEERREALTDLNRTGMEHAGAGHTLERLFAEQVRRSPDAVAASFREQQVTYGELKDRAGRLARFLRSLGVAPEVRVALCAERSPDMVLGILGILEAGGAYVPIDPAYPEERRALMLEDARASVLLTQERLAHGLKELRAGARVVRLDADWPEIAAHSSAEDLPPALPENLAYVIYTSGSTGRPKGVMISHRAIANRLLWKLRVFPLGPGDAVLQKTPYSFDASVWEIFVPLFSGARLALAEPGGHQDPAYLLRAIAEEQVTALQLVPSMLPVFLDQPGVGEAGRSLRGLFCGGEALPAEAVDRASALLPGAAVRNLYGPTEASIDVASQLCEPGRWDGIVPIGRPIDNIRLFVLDPRGVAVPPGLTGELHLGGVNLARGYLGRPDLTAERFVPDAWSGLSGERLYRSGDLVRLSAAGALEFLGRADGQVKLRGFRIELGEIEAALLRHPAVREAAVLVREDAPGDPRLVAYAAPEETSAEDLRGLLAGRLPEHMVPSAFVTLPALPRLPNGKLDRQSLPAPERGAGLAGFHGPRTSAEELMAVLWQDLLQVERVGIRDSFFALGGYSLLATRLVTRIRQAFGVDLSLQAVFEAPTLAALAAEVAAARGAAAGRRVPPLVPVPREPGAELPLSFAQQRLWFLHQLDPESPAYNLPMALRLLGPLNLPAFAAALREVVRRHESLRTRFPDSDGQPVQVIDPPPASVLSCIDLSALPEAEREAEARRIAAAEASRPFDLAAGPLIRPSVLRLDEGSHVLLAIVHHIVSDGWSLGVLVREVAALYQAFKAGTVAELPELPVQYADFAAWQRSWLSGEVLEAELAWWRERLAGAPPHLDLPVDRPRSAGSPRSGRQFLRLSADLARELGDRAGATPFMVLMAAFQALLGRWCNQDDVLAGAPIANRTREEIEGLIGFFVNTLVLRADLSDGPSFRRHLERVREATLAAADHQEVPFEQVVEAVRPGRVQGENPLVQALLVLQNAPVGPLDLPDLALRPEPVSFSAAKLDLALELMETPEGIGGVWQYRADLFDAVTVARLSRHFANLLAAAVEAPERSVFELPLLDEAEAAQLLVEWNDTAAATPESLVHEMFEQRAAERPEAAALVFSGGTWTYGELDRRANGLARRLRGLGVRPERVVAICAERSPEMVLALLAVLKVGGAWLPLDPAYPAERLRFMWEDAGRPLLLAPTGLLEGLPAEAQGRCLPLTAEEEDASAPETGVAPDHLAYVIYTSGSTGRPKGTLLTHGGLRNTIAALVRAYRIDGGSRMLQFSSFSFDASVAEILGALTAGAELHLAAPHELLDLVRLLRERRITVATLPPSALLASPPEDLPELATLVVAGEACPPKLAATWGRGRYFVDAYGPTEATIAASAGAGTAIGRPLPNVRIHLLGGGLEPVPIGAAGELWVAGAGLARGYLGRPDLTADRFRPDPFATAPGGRLYRTGDLARRLPDGELDFLGRIDHQVKVRGFRVETGEIEAALARHPAVRAAAVVAHTDRIAAYVVPADEAEANVSELRGFLRRELPDYMIPAAWVTLPALPLTQAGKVDHRALPAPGTERPDLAAGYAAPSGPVEEVLADLWARLLGLEQVGAHDDFFELGGHSLLATQMVSRIRKVFKMELPLRELFGRATVAALARWLQDHEAKPGQAAAIARAALKIAAMPAAELQSELESRRAERRMAQ